MVKQKNLLIMLILLTSLLVIAQFSFLGINYITGGLEGSIKAVLKSPILQSKEFIIAVLQFIFSQLLLYSAYVYLIWITARSIPRVNTYDIGLFLWCVSLVAILSGNAYFVTHSFFAKEIITHEHLKIVFIVSSAIWLFATTFVFIRYPKICGILLAVFLAFHFIKFPTTQTMADEKTPNVFIIGFDALRPDYVQYGQHFKEFIQSSVNFTEAYTPLARTFPSWMGILSGLYPLHHKVRDNNAIVDFFPETLAQKLKTAGYQTLYASDDHRFSLINKQLGFDDLVGPKGTAADFVLGTLNDFPLSNLLIPTPIGKLLFPYNYANHGSAMTYDPNNFLGLVEERLNHINNKPLFLALHFNLTGWPFYWFNDKAAPDSKYPDLYKNSVLRVDSVLARFTQMLEERGLLKHAIFVLISDHGISLLLPNERLVNNPSHPIGTKAFGYGSDILSLVQHHSILAFRGYGFDLGKPHNVAGTSTLFDITPTLLDVLHLSPMAHVDGISLKPYLYNQKLKLSNDRPLYLETGFSNPEINRGNVSLGKLAKKYISIFQADAKTGEVLIQNDIEKRMIADKQRAIMQGNWFLAYFPEALKWRVSYEKNNPQIAHFDAYKAPPYAVLVNLKNGQWTNKLNSSFAMTAPVKKLKEELNQFYGPEMNYYVLKTPLTGSSLEHFNR